MQEYTQDQKREIAFNIKPISLDIVDKEFNELVVIGETASTKSSRCRVGNNVVDYFTFVQRLETKGKYNTNYFEFISNLEEFEKKKFIKTMLAYYVTEKNKNGTKNRHIVLKEVYNICISAINIFRPLNAMEIYAKYKPSCILDFCAGWGGRAVGAAALNIPKYIGVEINLALEQGYTKMADYLKSRSSTSLEMIFKDALNVDYSVMEYDMVFTSPPYYFLEKYEHNVPYESKQEMNDKFYGPLFKETYKYLKKDGYYILNVNSEIYDKVCIGVFGEAHEKINLKKSKRQNDYTEYIYIWHKK